MFFRIRAYLNFILRAKNQYGLHSPFIYALITRCFYDRKKYGAYKQIRQGCHFLNRNEKQPFYKRRIPLKKYKLINRLVRYFKAKNILVYSLSGGLPAVALSARNNCRLWILELPDKPLKQGTRAFIENKIERSKIIQPPLNANGHHFDLIFVGAQIDGKNRSEALNTFLPLLSPRGVLLIDRIHRSAKTDAHWQAVKAHPRVRVSVDLFFIGLVFIKKDQAEQHFRIRL